MDAISGNKHLLPPPWQTGKPRTPEDVSREEQEHQVDEVSNSGALKDPLTGKFLKGHGGRPKGSKNRVTIAVENMMHGEAEAISRRCIELAKAGDPTALRLVIERICPVRRGRPLPDIQRDPNEGSVEALLRAVLDGTITPSEGKDVVDLIESAARVAAVQALGEMRQQQLKESLEDFKRLQATGVVAGGVMLVPFAADPKEWEAKAIEAQAQLIAKHRE